MNRFSERLGRLIRRILPRTTGRPEAEPSIPPEEPSLQPPPFAPAFPARDLKISDRDLEELNAMLDWHAGTLLGGRLVGRLGARKGKRMRPEPIPDRRIVWLNDRVGLRGKTVLEVGCFEGIHTAGLRLFAEDVTAVDIRPANVVKTLARLSYHGTSAKVFQADVEGLDPGFGSFDVVFHCGVLYHLEEPVRHLISIGRMCSFLFLDTHVAPEGEASVGRELEGTPYHGALRKEGGWDDPFSGKSSRSFWLSEESLLRALERAGFSRCEILERRSERNGPRVALLAFKAPAGAPSRAPS